jgi:hypothetical protein
VLFFDLFANAEYIRHKNNDSAIKLPGYTVKTAICIDDYRALITTTNSIRKIGLDADFGRPIWRALDNLLSGPRSHSFDEELFVGYQCSMHVSDRFVAFFPSDHKGTLRLYDRSIYELDRPIWQGGECFGSTARWDANNKNCLITQLEKSGYSNPAIGGDGFLLSETNKNWEIRKVNCSLNQVLSLHPSGIITLIETIKNDLKINFVEKDSLDVIGSIDIDGLVSSYNPNVDFSRDGRYVAIHNRAQETVTLFDMVRQNVISTSYKSANPQFSPDGQRLYINVEVERKKYERQGCILPLNGEKPVILGPVRPLYNGDQYKFSPEAVWHPSCELIVLSESGYTNRGVVSYQLITQV